MNILSITNCPLDSRLGSGKTVIQFTRGLQGLGHRVEVCAPAEYQWLPGVARASKMRTAIGADLMLRQKLKSGTTDLIEFYGDEFAYSIWRLSRRSRRPLLISHTNGLELLDSERKRVYVDPAGNAVSRLYREAVEKSHDLFGGYAFGCTDGFVALCEVDRQYVVNAGLYKKERTAVVEPGLDDEYLSALIDQPRREKIAFTGSWIDRKGIRTFVRVMSDLLAQRPALELEILGAGADAGTILKLFPEDTRARINVHGRLTEADIAGVLTQAKVFFFPSQYEGFGIALAEAMACGCAAVTTRTGFGAGLRGGEEALLCEFDDVAAMKAAVTSLLENEPLRQSIASGGWRRTRSLTWDRNVRLLDQVYREWLKEHAG